MIYELRTYTLGVGKLQEYLDILNKGWTIRERHGKPVGFWYTDIGPLNEVVHLWPYEDLAHRDKVRKVLAQERDWQEVVSRLRPLMLSQSNKILVPTEFSPLK